MKTTEGLNLLSTSNGTAIGNEVSFTTNTFSTVTGTTFTTSINNWSTPERLEANEVGETIEMIYKQTLSFSYWPAPPTEERVFKIVYSCIDGKWDKSEPIYGKIVPAQVEYFEFED